MKKIVLSESNCGGKRDREESQEVQEFPVSPYRPQKFANPFKFFESHINNTPEGVDLHENEELERPEAPQKNNNDDYGALGKDNLSEGGIGEHTKITKNDNAPNDKSSLPSSLQQGPHQDETLNNDPKIGSSISLEPVFSQQGNIPNRDNEKEESSLPSSSIRLFSETPCQKLSFKKFTLSNALK